LLVSHEEMGVKFEMV